MTSNYNPSNWYWLVGNKPSQVFSSAVPGYVALNNATYDAWTAAGNKATNALSDGELTDVLAKAGLPTAVVAAAGVTSMGNVPASDALPAMLAAGCQITSTSTPALNGLYPIDPATAARITAEQVMIQVSGKFTNGQTTRAWYTATGTAPVFTTTQFTAFAEAVAGYVDGIFAGVTAMAANSTPTWPAQPTIA
jgi:hypothetical protein